MVTTTDSNACQRVDSIAVLFINTAPNASLGNDTAFCSGDSVTLIPAGSADDYLWSDASANASLTVFSAELYSVTLSDSTSGCFDSDSIDIDVNPLPAFSLGNDTTLCEDSLSDGIDLSGPNSMSVYDWSTNETSQSIVVNGFGLYALQVTDTNGCIWIDSIAVAADTCSIHW